MPSSTAASSNSNTNNIMNIMSLINNTQTKPIEEKTLTPLKKAMEGILANPSQMTKITNHEAYAPTPLFNNSNCSPVKDDIYSLLNESNMNMALIFEVLGDLGNMKTKVLQIFAELSTALSENMDNLAQINMDGAKQYGKYLDQQATDANNKIIAQEKAAAHAVRKKSFWEMLAGAVVAAIGVATGNVGLIVIGAATLASGVISFGAATAALSSPEKLQEAFDGHSMLGNLMQSGIFAVFDAFGSNGAQYAQATFMILTLCFGAADLMLDIAENLAQKTLLGAGKALLGAAVLGAGVGTMVIGNIKILIDLGRKFSSDEDKQNSLLNDQMLSMGLLAWSVSKGDNNAVQKEWLLPLMMLLTMAGTVGAAKMLSSDSAAGDLEPATDILDVDAAESSSENMTMSQKVGKIMQEAGAKLMNLLAELRSVVSQIMSKIVDSKTFKLLSNIVQLGMADANINSSILNHYKAEINEISVVLEGNTSLAEASLKIMSQINNIIQKMMSQLMEASNKNLEGAGKDIQDFFAALMQLIDAKRQSDGLYGF